MAIANDCRFALRQLLRSPGFTLTVLATLGLCIGANTAVYSVLDAVLLRPVPYPRPERLAMLMAAWRLNGQESTDSGQSAAMFETVRDLTPSLDAAAYGGNNGVNFAAEGRLEYVQQQRVSAGFFRVLQVTPQLGREFTRAEDLANGPTVAVLSYDFWKRVFHGDPAVLGRAIHLRGEPYTVIGVMPRDLRTFRVSDPVDLWTPLRPSRSGEGGDANYEVVARVKDGASWEQAEAQLKALDGRLLEGADAPKGASVEERLIPFHSALTSDVRGTLLLTWGAVLMVLLIGCVNIAGLLLARSGMRSREIATRMALGGGRAAIVRQLLVESLLLGAGGCAVGLLAGSFAIDGLKYLAGNRIPSWNPVELDGRVLLAMFAAAILTSMLFGLAPALQTTQVNIRAVLMEGGRGGSVRRRWSRNFLVGGEVALSLVLLVGAGLLLRTLSYLNGLNPGFDAHHVITAQTSLQDARYQTLDAVDQLFTKGLERIRSIPGVQSAAVALTLPYQRPLNFPMRAVDGKMTERRTVRAVYLTPGYLETMRIPMQRGRAVLNSDSEKTAPVAVVSQAFANRFFEGGNALGRHLEMDGVTREIVGIAGDVRQRGLGVDPTVYLPVAQTSSKFLKAVHTWFAPHWVVRTSGAVAEMTTQVQAAVAAIDPLLPMAEFRMAEELHLNATSEQRYNATLFSIFAGLALLLAGVGIYGLISQSITQRTHELGIRMALGATATQTIQTAMKPGILLGIAGVIAGCALSWMAAPLLRHLLAGVRPTDPLTFAATAGILLLIAGVASLLPALRILRLDPSQTLRSE